MWLNSLSICRPRCSVSRMGRDLYDRHPIVKETIDKPVRFWVMDLRDLIDKWWSKAKSDSLHATSHSSYIRCHLPIIERKRLSARHGGRTVPWEYSALVASGSWLEDAVALVAKFGAYMEEAAPAGSGKMAFCYPVEVIEEACETAFKVEQWLSNYNTPSQIVIVVVRWLRLTAH